MCLPAIYMLKNLTDWAFNTFTWQEVIQIRERRHFKPVIYSAVVVYTEDVSGKQLFHAHTSSHGVPHLLRCCCCCCCYWPVRNFHIPSRFWLYKNLRGGKKKQKQMRERRRRRRRSGVWNKDAWERLFWLYFLFFPPPTTSNHLSVRRKD